MQDNCEFITQKIIMIKKECPKCNSYIHYKTVEYDKEIYSEEGTCMGVYTYKEAYCPNCNKLIYVDDIQKENIRNKNNKIREIAGIISAEEIKRIPRRYFIPRKYLNVVLNIKTQIWKDEVPTSSESKLLKKVLNNKQEYLKLLQKHKDSIPIEIYKQSIKRATKLK